MGRQARQYSTTGLYHIVFMGMNRHNTFEEEEEEDFIKIKDNIQSLKQEMQFEINAFCLMTNHAHIL
jgi:putative transposase